MHTSDAPERRTVLHVVGKRVDIATGEAWSGATPSTRIVVIGAKGVDDDALNETFDACTA